MSDCPIHHHFLLASKPFVMKVGPPSNDGFQELGDCGTLQIAIVALGSRQHICPYKEANKAQAFELVPLHLPSASSSLVTLSLVGETQ